MRDIEFRGKRKSDEKWVYGYYATDYNDRGYIASGYIGNSNGIYVNNLYDSFDEIIPETVRTIYRTKR